jgi:integrase
MARRNQGPRLRYFQDRKAYYITWTVNGRSRKCSTGTANREEAENVFSEWLQRRSRPTGPSDPARTLVTDMLIDYMTDRGPKVIGKDTMARAVENLARGWEGKTVAEVTPNNIAMYAKTRGVAAGTLRRELGVLQSAFNHGHRHGKLTRSVAVELPAAPPARDKWLTRQEAARLLRAARKDRNARLYMPLFILSGLYTGRRKEAILSLRWSQIDLNAGQIDFEIEGRARTKKRRGKVPIPPRLLPHLRRARRRGSDLGPVLHINGKPIGNIKKGFAAACRRAGLVRWEKVKEDTIDGAPCSVVRAVPTVTPHTLRHTAASWLMQSGIPILEAARYLAMSEKTLVATYGHHHPEWLRDAAHAIGRYQKPRRGIGA